MVHSNKVLTVSYGTFSCTLEGFEDSFDTMKAIAEYFRDLAADDRYFGAEPPQPDTEMLARIAEREIARQVQARREGSGFVLRAASAAEAAAPAALTAAEAPVEAPVAAAPEKPAKAAAPEAAEAPGPEAAATEVPEAVIAEAAAVITAGTAPLAEPEIEPEIDLVAEAAEAPEDETAPAAVSEPTDETVAAFMATVVPAAEPVAEVIDERPAPARPSADSIAAKLQRIRAVVSRNEQAAPVDSYDEEYGEDQLSEAAFVAETVRDISEALQEDDEDAPLTLTAEAEAEEDTGDEALFADLDTDEDEDGEAAENILAEAEEESLPQARVVKVKRQEFEAALAAGKIEEVAENVEEEAEEVAEAAPAPARELPASTLSPEDEADLMRELAEVEAELRGDHARIAEDDDEEDEDEGEDQPILLTAALPQAEPEPELHEAAQSDLSRLMAAADAKLGEPEAATTRETYSHLRAAVAATEAEHSAGGLPSQHPDADAYRADLARVVHPRRPVVAGGPRPRRIEGDQKPAPLKLVAEQRVDDMAPQAPRPGPVRPRRVAAAVETPRPTEAPSGGFATFAAEMGATELPDLLEAAAAYMQFVEGREQFTRPQLIHKAREGSAEEFNREDGLRSFGLLLREGKIVKKDSGRFVASGEIGFQPASRAAG